MAVHRLTALTIGAPSPAQTAQFYRVFGLVGEGLTLASASGGDQLTFVRRRVRSLVELGLGADTPEDLPMFRGRLDSRGYRSRLSEDSLRARIPGTPTSVALMAAPRLAEVATAPAMPTAGSPRAAAVLASRVIRPHHLGHVVLASTDVPAAEDFFVRGLGFEVSDRVGRHGVFLRCSTEHHNVLLNASPIPYLHHTAWSVSSVDDIGVGAARVLADYPDSHVWGLGRHLVGSNVFWYLRDPAGNFCEYYTGMDSIDDAWVAESFATRGSLYTWGPPPPEEFMQPSDVAAQLQLAGSRSA
jgi:catechol 2,3-dioxygenase-like lactoylglutathione lyase family enzyme